MKIFIVHPHPEPRSFNGALTDTARRCLAEAGHALVVSDLYALGWNPRSDRANFTTVLDPGVFRQQQEEAHASAQDGFAADVRAELDKLLWCDALIFQFPLWWFSLPAMLKGWVDRVFAMGAVYGGGLWYDRGRFAGRRAMLSLTVGVLIDHRRVASKTPSPYPPPARGGGTQLVAPRYPPYPTRNSSRWIAVLSRPSAPTTPRYMPSQLNGSATLPWASTAISPPEPPIGPSRSSTTPSAACARS